MRREEKKPSFLHIAEEKRTESDRPSPKHNASNDTSPRKTPWYPFPSNRSNPARKTSHINLTTCILHFYIRILLSLVLTIPFALSVLRLAALLHARRLHLNGVHDIRAIFALLFRRCQCCKSRAFCNPRRREAWAAGRIAVVAFLGAFGPATRSAPCPTRLSFAVAIAGPRSRRGVRTARAARTSRPRARRAGACGSHGRWPG